MKSHRKISKKNNKEGKVSVFGIRLQSELLRNGIKQKDLAEKLELTATTIGNYISGRREPELEIVVTIADICGCTVDYLLGKSDVRNYDVPDLQINDEEIRELMKKVDETTNELIKQGKITEEVKKQVISDTLQYFGYNLSKNKPQ